MRRRFNLKKGRGGLVDIEFLTQMLQLAHGHGWPDCAGAKPWRRCKRSMPRKYSKPQEYRLLAEGYLFLRRLDHRLRLERDQSIDAFEAEPGRLEGIARALGYSKPKSATSKRTGQSGRKLLRDYQIRREQIRACYERYFVGSNLSLDGAFPVILTKLDNDVSEC